MIGFIKHKVWVSQLAHNAITYDNRDIKGHYSIAQTVLNTMTHTN